MADRASDREHIDRLVAAAPLPTAEQARRLWLLLQPKDQPTQPDQPDQPGTS